MKSRDMKFKYEAQDLYFCACTQSSSRMRNRKIIWKKCTVT